MSLKTFAFVALVAASLGIGAGPASAQSAFAAEPANLPPSDFTGRQFVDNNGCIFVRAGFDGNTTWVPRVTRSRQHICGQTPTFRTATSAAPAPRAVPVEIAPAPAVVAAPAPRPVVTARPAPAAAAPAATTTRVAPRVQPAPAPAPRVVRAPASKPVEAEPPRIVRRVPTVAPAPAPAAPVVPNQRLQRLDAETCRYGWVYREVNGVRKAFNCRPASEVQGSLLAPEAGKRITVASNGALPGHTRIVPRHVYENRVRLNGSVPDGYRPAWEDDRLNPHRAWQTVDGYRDTQRVWTNTVPRRLVTQPRKWWQAPHTVKEPVIAYHATSGRDVHVSTRGALREPVVSTRSAPVKAGARYVEIGVFTTTEKAATAAARLAAAGLPVRTGAYKSMTRVMVGPYADPVQLQAALRTVRGTGYVQAYLR